MHEVQNSLHSISASISVTLLATSGILQAATHQRKLSADEEVEAAKLLSMKANKKMVQDKMAGMTGKVILLKDLSNMSGKMKAGRTRNDLEAAVKLLTEKHGKCIYVYTVIPPPPPLPMLPHLHSLCRLIILRLG